MAIRIQCYAKQPTVKHVVTLAITLIKVLQLFKQEVTMLRHK